jgi:hypothetical protein
MRKILSLFIIFTIILISGCSKNISKPENINQDLWDSSIKILDLVKSHEKSMTPIMEEEKQNEIKQFMDLYSVKLSSNQINDDELSFCKDVSSILIDFALFSKDLENKDNDNAKIRMEMINKKIKKIYNNL